MRVISGEKRGTKLIAPDGMVTRPTDDRLKENVFNLLGKIKSDSVVLDLFAGSGQIGIEFLSRGASQCFFVDKNIKAIKSIKDNLIKTKYLEKSKIIKSNVKTALSRLESQKFDYIYIDPPYDDIKNLTEVFNIILKSDIIKLSTIIIIETIKGFTLDYENILKEREYGKRKIFIVGGIE